MDDWGFYFSPSISFNCIWFCLNKSILTGKTEDRRFISLSQYFFPVLTDSKFRISKHFVSKWSWFLSVPESVPLIPARRRPRQADLRVLSHPGLHIETLLKNKPKQKTQCFLSINPKYNIIQLQSRVREYASANVPNLCWHGFPRQKQTWIILNLSGWLPPLP